MSVLVTKYYEEQRELSLYSHKKNVKPNRSKCWCEEKRGHPVKQQLSFCFHTESVPPEETLAGDSTWRWDKCLARPNVSLQIFIHKVKYPLPLYRNNGIKFRYQDNIIYQKYFWRKNKVFLRTYENESFGSSVELVMGPWHSAINACCLDQE